MSNHRRGSTDSKCSGFAALNLASLSALCLSGCTSIGAGTTELATTDQIPELMRAFEVDGLAVAAVSGNDILVSDGFGVRQDGEPFTSASSCGLYSATKVLASLTYAKLEQDGRIDLDAPLGAYLEDAPKDWTEILFFRLLNHTSGITMAVNKPEFGDIASNPQAGNVDIYHLVRDKPMDYQPGEYSRYRQSGYAIGEMILRAKLGDSFDDLVAQYITEPAGMTDTAHPASTDASQPPLILSAGGYETTAEDMARLFLGINSGAVIEADDWKGLLLDEKYLFDNYSLGSVIEHRNDVLTLGHSGGGARANIRYAPDQRVGVMVCTDDTANNGLAITLARMFIREITSGETPKTPVFVALADYQKLSGAEVVAAYNQAVSQKRYDLSDSEGLLNTIGYSFLGRDQTQDAIDVFSLNAELFPQSPNTHDSLGEALMYSGDAAGALAAYRKVLELDPGNANATTMIQRIEAGETP